MNLLKSFSQLPAVKKDTIFGAAKKNFGPFYFVTALGIWGYNLKRYKPINTTVDKSRDVQQSREILRQ